MKFDVSPEFINSDIFEDLDGQFIVLTDRLQCADYKLGVPLFLFEGGSHGMRESSGDRGRYMEAEVQPTPGRL